MVFWSSDFFRFENLVLQQYMLQVNQIKIFTTLWFGNITLNGVTPTPPLHSQYSWQQASTSTYYIDPQTNIITVALRQKYIAFISERCSFHFCLSSMIIPSSFVSEDLGTISLPTIISVANSLSHFHTSSIRWYLNILNLFNILMILNKWIIRLFQIWTIVYNYLLYILFSSIWYINNVTWK